ncbi:MAG: hypothetical protein Phyf2KO_03690 [Phycisphaerales bacterium]
MSRPGFVIFVVLIAVLAMAAGLTAMLAGVRGQSDSIRALVHRQESRLAARSAALAIGAECESQLDEVLAGELPSLLESEDVLRFEEEPSWRWQIADADDSWNGVEPLAARVDVNHSSNEVVTAVLGADAEASTFLEQRPYRTLGMIERELRDSELSAKFTVSSVDTALRSGAGGQSGESGRERITPGEGGDIPFGLSADGARLFDEVSGGTQKVLRRSDLLRLLNARSVPQEDWDILLDVFEYGIGEGNRGLIDLARAPESVLAALPGFDEETAGELVDHREGMTTHDLAGYSWPVREGVVELDEYLQCIDLLTTRSMQYLVRFTVYRDPNDSMNETLAYGIEEVRNDPVYCSYDMVIDLSGERASIAYLRDVTFESWATRRNDSSSSELSPINAENDESSIQPARVNAQLSSDVQSSARVVDEGEPEDSAMPAGGIKAAEWGRYEAGGQG